LNTYIKKKKETPAMDEKLTTCTTRIIISHKVQLIFPAISAGKIAYKKMANNTTPKDAITKEAVLISMPNLL
jgi:hypothetical protein